MNCLTICINQREAECVFRLTVLMWVHVNEEWKLLSRSLCVRLAADTDTYVLPPTRVCKMIIHRFVPGWSGLIKTASGNSTFHNLVTSLEKPLTISYKQSIFSAHVQVLCHSWGHMEKKGYRENLPVSQISSSTMGHSICWPRVIKAL